MAAASAAVAALRRSKSALRKQVATVLKSLSADTIADQSARVADALKTVPEFVASKAVFTFLSMPDEVQTWATVSGLFVDGKRVFVPRVVGKRAMAVLEVESAARLSSLTENSWGIPEPPAPLIEPFHEGETAEALTKATADDPELDWSRVAGDASHVAAKHGAKGVIDVVLMPGLAFDRQGRRCGHGRGYYGEIRAYLTQVPTR
jgi:5-formyltetrahydrofolate cyclo-ligase